MWTGKHSDFLMAFLGITLESLTSIGHLAECWSQAHIAIFTRRRDLGLICLLFWKFSGQRGALPLIDDFFFFQQPIYRLLSKLNVPECLLLQGLVMVTLPMHFSPLTIQLRTSCCLQLFFSCFCFFILHLFFAFIFKTILPDWGYILRRHSLKSLPSEKHTGHANSRCSIKCCWIQWN